MKLLDRCRLPIGLASQGLLLLGLIAFSPVARADLQVLESNSPIYPSGKTVPDDEKFDQSLGPGCAVRVLKLSSNVTFLYKGEPRSQKSRSTGGTRDPRPPASACDSSSAPK